MNKPRVTRRTVLAGAGAGALWMAVGGESARAGTAEPAGLRYHYPVSRDPGAVRTDLCVYGGTSAGVVTAVRAAQAGLSVALVAFGRHLGGITASGLGATDTGSIEAIGGLSREFYRRLGARYGLPEAFRFEPSVAEMVFDEWVDKADVRVFREHRLHSLQVAGNRIRVLQAENGKQFVADVYVDASYEGDLLAAAGVSYTVGREGNAAYGETLNGVQFRSGHQFRVPIDPYVVPGDPGSGLLQGVQPDPPGTTGEGDHRIQAFNFRLCLTRTPDRLPFPRPAGYDPDRFELLLRYINAGIFDVFGNNQAMPGGKTDMNNNGAVASDNVGRNYGWPEADYATRELIFQDHVTYQQGMLYFLANDPRVPQNIRDSVSAWGLPRDEFVDTGGWPHELYVREARRMVSDYVMTEHDCRWTRAAEDPVALASYNMDSHNCKRVVVDGFARNEGDVQVGPAGPYGVSYRSIVPARGECENLLVTCALSASHIAFGSIRMEPVFMALGHAVGVAAQLAIRGGTSVQDVDYLSLRRRLRSDQAVLTWPPDTGPISVGGPLAFAAGEPADVTVAFENDEGMPVTDVRADLVVPSAWAAQRSTRDRTEVVEPGETFGASWKVTATSPQRAIDKATLTGSVRYEVAGDPEPFTLSVAREVAVAEPVLPPLAAAASTTAAFGQRDRELAILSNGEDVWVGIDEYGAIFHPGAAGPDTVATVTLVEQEATHPNARAGLVFRNDLRAAGSSTGYVMLVAKPVGGLLLLWDANGDGTVESAVRAEMSATPYPVSFRLARRGTSFHASYALDGTSWTDMGTIDVPTAADVQDVGVLCCSHVTGRLGLAVFEDLAVDAGPGEPAAQITHHHQVERT